MNFKAKLPKWNIKIFSWNFEGVIVSQKSWIGEFAVGIWKSCGQKKTLVLGPIKKWIQPVVIGPAVWCHLFCATFLPLFRQNIRVRMIIIGLIREWIHPDVSYATAWCYITLIFFFFWDRQILKYIGIYFGPAGLKISL